MRTSRDITALVPLGNHLRALRLPTCAREYEKVAMESAWDRADYPRCLLRHDDGEMSPQPVHFRCRPPMRRPFDARLAPATSSAAKSGSRTMARPNSVAKM
jgi:hypothetical protein